MNQAGNLQCNSLTILGGADLAEPFAMSHQDIAAGSVVVIDEERSIMARSFADRALGFCKISSRVA